MSSVNVHHVACKRTVVHKEARQRTDMNQELARKRTDMQQVATPNKQIAREGQQQVARKRTPVHKETRKQTDMNGYVARK